jgi:two-component system response regulator YesN
MNKILIVEDNEDFCQILRTALNEKLPGIMLYEVSNEMEAVQTANDVSPDIVLMGIGLPLMNGLNATKRLKCSEDPFWVIIIAGNDIPEYMEAAQKAGVDYFLSINSVKLGDVICLIQDLLSHDDALFEKWNKFRVSK